MLAACRQGLTQASLRPVQWGSFQEKSTERHFQEEQTNVKNKVTWSLVPAHLWESPNLQSCVTSSEHWKNHEADWIKKKNNQTVLRRCKWLKRLLKVHSMNSSFPGRFSIPGGKKRNDFIIKNSWSCRTVYYSCMKGEVSELQQQDTILISCMAFSTVSLSWGQWICQMACSHVGLFIKVWTYKKK